jgi:UDP-3-O-[3-hydroxymyristoyl] glucosamine N-acyltransferase
MRLSQLNSVVSMALLRDGEFASLGVLSHRPSRMLVSFYDRAYKDELAANNHVACVLTTSDLAALVPEHTGLAVCSDPKSAFYHIHEYLLKHTDFYGTDFASEIAPDARIHERACVARRNVRIGTGCVVEPGAVVFERTIMGHDVVIRANAVIGGEGFEPKYVDGRHVLIPHAGGVRLADRVEVHALTHIQKAVFNGFTEIGEDTKVDALCHISHHVLIGRRCEVVAGTVVAGSAVVGDDVFLGPNCTICPEVHVGNRAFVTPGAVVTRDVPEGSRVSGNFAIAHDRFIGFLKSIR